MNERNETAYKLGQQRATREIQETGFARGIRPIDPVAFRTFGATYLEHFERGYRSVAAAR